MIEWTDWAEGITRRVAEAHVEGIELIVWEKGAHGKHRWDGENGACGVAETIPDAKAAAEKWLRRHAQRMKERAERILTAAERSRR